MSKASGEKLELRYVPLDQAVIWERNSKKHDLPALAKSIQKYGFLDPMKFDTKLNNGKGGIVEGNGRAAALHEMFTQNTALPRGILQNGNGWLVPVLFGVDAKSQKMAQAYAIDHNNLTMRGGDFGILEIARMWDDKEYAKLLEDLQASAELPVSIDDAEIAAYINTLNSNGEFNANNEWQGMPEFEQKDKTAFQSIHIHFKNQKNVNDFSKLIKQKITSKTRSLWYPEIEIEKYADKRYENKT